MSRVEEHLAPLGYPLPLVHPSGMTVLVTDRAPLDRPIAVLRRQSASTLLARASIGLRCRFRWRSLLLERSDVQLTPNASIWCRLFGRAGSPKRVAFRSALLFLSCLRVHTKVFSEVCSGAGQQSSPPLRYHVNLMTSEAVYSITVRLNVLGGTRSPRGARACAYARPCLCHGPPGVSFHAEAKPGSVINSDALRAPGLV